MAIELPSKPDTLDERLALLEDAFLAERLMHDNPARFFAPEPPRTQREILAWTTRGFGSALLAVTAALSIAAGYFVYDNSRGHAAVPKACAAGGRGRASGPARAARDAPPHCDASRRAGRSRAAATVPRERAGTAPCERTGRRLPHRAAADRAAPRNARGAEAPNGAPARAGCGTADRSCATRSLGGHAPRSAGTSGQRDRRRTGTTHASSQRARSGNRNRNRDGSQHRTGYDHRNGRRRPMSVRAAA